MASIIQLSLYSYMTVSQLLLKTMNYEQKQILQLVYIKAVQVFQVEACHF